jgi:hypothetical protein
VGDRTLLRSKRYSIKAHILFANIRLRAKMKIIALLFAVSMLNKEVMQHKSRLSSYQLEII